jgi:hypothetical protein
LTAKQRAFLAAFALLGNPSAAARLSKVGRRSHYDWTADPAYAAAVSDAREEYCDSLRAEIRERALRGIAEPVIYQGQLQFEPVRCKTTGRVKRYKDGSPRLSKVPLVVFKKSDVLLMFEAKKHMPEYREAFTQSIEHTGAGGAPIAVHVTFVKP